MTGKFYSNGKLLITGEYFVLDGAIALAVPCNFGQSLEVKQTAGDVIAWTALDHKGNEWFSTKLKLNRNKPELLSSNPGEVETRLLKILKEAHQLNPQILTSKQRFEVVSKLDFPQNWGLGSSSTLINNIARWFEIDAYVLLEKTFGGSGYDIAAAQIDVPITYSNLKGKRNILKVPFDPGFKDQLFFVHLNLKQDSRESIGRYRKVSKEHLEENILKFSSLTQRFISCIDINEFQLLIEIHEKLVSTIIQTPRIKPSHFPDFPGAIKSLGGWGGDFILATGGEDEKNYFKDKGYNTILTYEEMVKKSPTAP